MKVEIMSKRQIKLIIDTELRKQNYHLYRVLDKLRKRITALEEKIKND